MAGYDFNVNPVQIESGTDLRARSDAAKARKIELQQRQIQLDQAKKQQADEKNRDAAAVSAYQPQSYTPPQTGVNVGGANLGYQPAAVQGPQEFNRGSYIDALRKTDPFGAMQQQNQFQLQDIEHQKQMAALSEQFSKTDQESLKTFNAGWDTLGRYLQAVDGAPDQMKPQIYAQALQHAAQNPAIAHLGIAQAAPPQYDPQSFQQLKSQFMDVKQAADLANKRIDQQNVVRGQDMTAQTAKAGQAVTMRGQNMTDARSRDQNQIAREQKADLNRAADETQLAGVSASMDRLAAAANELKDHPGLGGITGISGALPNVPGGQAANAQAKLSTLKSQTAFSTLADLRNQSKTGGALGQISDKEEQMLSDNLAALDRAQSTAEYKKSLQAIIDFTTAAKQRARDAVGRKYTSKPSLTNQGPSSQQAAPAGATHAVVVNGQIVGYTSDGKTMTAKP